MQNTNKEQLQYLVILQSLETEIHKIKNALKKIPGMLQNLDDKLLSFEQEMEKETENIEKIKKLYREHETYTKDNLSKIQKSREKLGGVKNNKEYQSILKEIDELNKKNSAIEDQMIALLDQIDECESRIESQKEDLTAFSKEIETRKTSLNKDKQENEKKLAELDAKKNEVTTKIDSDYLDTFNRVRGIVGQTTMAQVMNSVCMGCNVNIPPQQYNELQRCDSLQLCPNCHRIIYWENQSERSE